MTPFDRAAGLAAGAIDRVFAAPWRIEGRGGTSVNDRRRADPARPAFERAAIWSTASRLEDQDIAGRTGEQIQQRRTQAMTLDLPAGLPWRPRQGDLARPLASGAWGTADRVFTVTDVVDIVEARTQLVLAAS